MLPKTIPSDTSDTCPTPVRHAQTQAPQASDTSDSKNSSGHHARAHAHTTIIHGVGRVGVSEKKVSKSKSMVCGPTDDPTGVAAGVGRSEMLKTVALAGAGTAAVQAAAASFAHLGPAQAADVFAVVPATANTIARMACGMADTRRVPAMPSTFILPAWVCPRAVDGLAQPKSSDSPNRSLCTAASAL